MTTATMETPGQCHPALRDLAEFVRDLGQRTDPVRAPLLSEPISADLEDTEFPELTLTRRTATFGLLPEYGRYVWHVWTDQFGRGIADEEAEWIPNPDAVMLPEWNPPTGRDDSTDDPAGDDCDICAGTGWDYIGRPCRRHGPGRL